MKDDIRSKDEEDLEAVAMCLKGNTDAFESIVNRYQKRMFNTVFRMLNSYDEASDVVQETFIAAYKGLKKFRKGAKFSTWLHAIALNQARNRIKKVTGRERREYSTDRQLMKEEGCINMEIASNAPSTLDVMEREVLREKVQECIEGLEKDFSSVMILRDIQELSYYEIGEILDIPPGTVRSRLYRARAGVRDCLKRIMGDK